MIILYSWVFFRVCVSPPHCAPFPQTESGKCPLSTAVFDGGCIRCGYRCRCLRGHRFLKFPRLGRNHLFPQGSTLFFSRPAFFIQNLHLNGSVVSKGSNCCCVLRIRRCHGDPFQPPATHHMRRRRRGSSCCNRNYPSRSLSYGRVHHLPGGGGAVAHMARRQLPDHLYDIFSEGTLMVQNRSSIAMWEGEHTM